MALRNERQGGTDVDRYIKESVRSYRGCNVKNNARRNSLQRKTLGIESERRIASAKLSREERKLREQLKQMNIEKAKNHIIHSLREPKPKKHTEAAHKEEHHIPTEPYPVTFSSHDGGAGFETAGKMYALHGRRRQSREFEDLRINTESGSLYHIHEADELDSPRRRTYSMSTAQKILGRGHKHSTGHSSHPNSPRHSPSCLRKKALLRKGGNSSSSSKESMNGSAERITSLDDLHWIGEPEAIHSVRRARKTVEEQELESEIHRLTLS